MILLGYLRVTAISHLVNNESPKLGLHKNIACATIVNVSGLAAYQ